MNAKLPDVLNRYFAAANAHDADRVAACFAADARVRDEGHDFRGQAAIRAWAEEAARKYRFSARVLAVEAAAEGVVATARVTGEFPGSPIDLRYRFELAGPLIAGLEIR